MQEEIPEKKGLLLRERLMLALSILSFTLVASLPVLGIQDANIDYNTTGMTDFVDEVWTGLALVLSSIWNGLGTAIGAFFDVQLTSSPWLLIFILMISATAYFLIKRMA